MQWEEHQNCERSWWGNCTSTYGEETKQLTYADRMGLVSKSINGKWPQYDMQGKSLLDLGGGPVSILLKTINTSFRTVVDPCNYPDWIKQRYEAANITYFKCEAENYISTRVYDECWIYNVLQHVQDPEQIIRTAKQYSKLIRIFEWIDIPPHDGHPHELKEHLLNLWLQGKGTIEKFNGENTCYGVAYYGIF